MPKQWKKTSLPDITMGNIMSLVSSNIHIKEIVTYKGGARVNRWGGAKELGVRQGAAPLAGVAP